MTKSHIEGFIENKSIVYQNNENVKSLLSKYQLKNTTDFGCVQLFKFLDKSYPCHYLDMADRIDKLSSAFDFKHIKSFFEMGGGFGANVQFLVTNFPNIKKILYLDVVPNIYVDTEYLRHHFN